MKPPLTYYGGKQQLAKEIIGMIPEHTVYCEPFFGGGAVFFAKPPSNVEVINDTNGELINFYRVLKTNFSKLQKEIRATLRSRELYRNAKVVYQNPGMFDEIKRAWAVWTLANQCYASIIGSSWGFDRKSRSATTRLTNKRDNFTEALAERLEHVQIECADAIEVIKRFDSKDTFFYLDPPYFNSDMGHYRGYTETDFSELLELLSTLQGRFMLSAYPSELLDGYVKRCGWDVREKEVALAVTVRFGGKNMKSELVVSNLQCN